MDEKLTKVYGFSMSAKDLRLLTVKKQKEFKEIVEGHKVFNIVNDNKKALFCFLDESDATACFELFKEICKTIKMEPADDFDDEELADLAKMGKKNRLTDPFKTAKEWLNQYNEDRAEETEKARLENIEKAKKA